MFLFWFLHPFGGLRVCAFILRSASSEACPRRRIVGKGGLPGNVPFSKHFADDELLAARGLSPKLLPWNIPEFRVIASSLDRLDGLLRAQGRSLAVRVRAMARASVVLRGVRGYHGVRWLNGPLFWPSTFRLLTAPAAAGARRAWQACSSARLQRLQK